MCSAGVEKNLRGQRVRQVISLSALCSFLPTTTTTFFLYLLILVPCDHSTLVTERVFAFRVPIAAAPQIPMRAHALQGRTRLPTNDLSRAVAPRASAEIASTRLIIDSRPDTHTRLLSAKSLILTHAHRYKTARSSIQREHPMAPIRNAVMTFNEIPTGRRFNLLQQHLISMIQGIQSPGARRSTTRARPSILIPCR